MDSFNNKTYLISGANSGIGKSLSEELIRRGANLFLVDITLDHFQERVGSKRPVGGGFLT